MTWESWFSLSSSLAMAGWASLILLPRWAWLRQGLSYGLVSLLAMAYVTLILGYFFQVEGGGFDSIAAVRTLFASDPVRVGCTTSPSISSSACGSRRALTLCR